MDEEDFDEVENLSILQVSAVSFMPSEISPEERNIASGMPDWGAKNDIIILADHRFTPLNDHILDLVPKMTGIPWASPKHLQELSTQKEAPCKACPTGDVGAAKDLEGARFISLFEALDSERRARDSQTYLGIWISYTPKHFWDLSTFSILFVSLILTIFRCFLFSNLLFLAFLHFITV